MSSTDSTATVTDATTTVSLSERLAHIESLLKDMRKEVRRLEKTANKRRRRTPKEGKSETPVQLQAWHNEVHQVWETLKQADPAVPYKKAVAEASVRRKAAVAPVVNVVVTPVVAAKSETKKATAKAAKASKA